MTNNLDLIKAINDLIDAQADQLWTISLSLIVADVFMIAHLIRVHRVYAPKWIVVTLLVLSAASNVFALVAGYMSKGALIQAIVTYSRNNGHVAWTFPMYAELGNLWQAGLVTAGVAIFVVCFFFYSRVIADLIVRGD